MGLFFHKKPPASVPNTSPQSVPAAINDATDSTESCNDDSSTLIKAAMKDPYFMDMINDDAYTFGSILLKNSDSFSIIVHQKISDCYFQKSWPQNGKQLSCCNPVFNNTGYFAFTLDSYFPQDPHLERELYLYNNCAEELLHIRYFSGDARNYFFSNNGLYFVVAETTRIYIYHISSGAMKIFSPDDFENTDGRSIIIDEENQTIAIQYTQHPDKPFYHFSFDGELFEKGAFKAQVEKKLALSSSSYDALQKLWSDIDAAKRPLSDSDYQHFSSELLKYTQDEEYSDWAYIYRSLGELDLEMGKKKEALEYFHKALSLDPQVGIKRVASKLEKELTAQS